MCLQTLRFGALLLIFIAQFLTVATKRFIPPADPKTPFKFQSSPVKSLHGDFIRKAMDLILEKGLYQNKSLEKLVFLEPDEIVKQFDFSLGEEGVSQEELLKIIEKLFEISPKPGHRFRLSKRVAGLDPLAVAGDWMATTMSNSLLVYLWGPIFSLMEIKMTEYLSRQIGWDNTGDGVSTSGAGVANSMALAVAMYHVDPKTRDIGLFHYKQKQLVFYVSEHASISWKTAAIYNGFGLNAIHEIAVDGWGRMDPIELNRQITQDKLIGRSPVMVVATAGTPVLGVIDPIDQIAAICKTHRIWLHVDAELAGGYLFTPNSHNNFRANKLSGIRCADSISISMWLFSAPYPNSMLLTQNPDALHKTFGLRSTYVFTGLELYNSTYDVGDHTIQTSRRPEIAKIWFAAARGELNNDELFKAQDDIKRKFLLLLGSAPGFVRVKAAFDAIRFQVPLVSFYYIPKEVREKTIDTEFTKTVSERMHAVKYQLQRRGLADVSISQVPNTPDCLTIAFKNSRLSSAELNWLVTTIGSLGENPSAEVVPYNQSSADANTEKVPTFPSQQIYSNLLKAMLNIAYDEGIFFSRKQKVFDFKQPETLINGEHSHFFDLPHNGTNVHKKFEESFKYIIKYTTHLGHPYFIYQLGSGLDPYTLVADYIVPVLNTPMISYYDGSAPFVFMEKELVKQMLKRIYNTEEGDGTIVDGGSMGNQIPIAMAKYYVHNENFKNEGSSENGGKKYIVYMSGDAHYSSIKGAMLQGIGKMHAVQVESNNIGQMRVGKLEEAIQKTIRDGNIPLMIVVTTGTTVYGAIDPVQEIITVAKQYKIWVHVDGMFGGLAAMSNTHFKKFKGIELSDSWGADVHKLMGSTMVSTILITRHKNILRHTFQLPDESQEIDWTAQRAGTPEDMNLVGRHAQLDKRNNVFKFWLLWKAKGRKGLEAHVDKIMSNKDFLIAELRKRKRRGFELVLDDFELTNVCFRYIPPYLNPYSNDKLNRSSEDWVKEMDIFTFSIQEEFVKNGIISFVTQRRYAASGDSFLFIKFAMMGSSLTHDDIRYLLDSIEFYGKQIRVTKQNGVVAADVNKCEKEDDPFGNILKFYSVHQVCRNNSCMVSNLSWKNGYEYEMQ